MTEKLAHRIRAHIINKNNCSGRHKARYIQFFTKFNAFFVSCIRCVFPKCIRYSFVCGSSFRHSARSKSRRSSKTSSHLVEFNRMIFSKYFDGSQLWIAFVHKSSSNYCLHSANKFLVKTKNLYHLIDISKQISTRDHRNSLFFCFYRLFRTIFIRLVNLTFVSVNQRVQMVFFNTPFVIKYIEFNLIWRKMHRDGPNCIVRSFKLGNLFAQFRILFK